MSRLEQGDVEKDQQKEIEREILRRAGYPVSSEDSSNSNEKMATLTTYERNQ